MRKYAIPQPMTVEYFFSDHLSSISLTIDSNGTKVSEMRYDAWGEVRYTWTDPNLNTSPSYTLSDYTFTGQYSYTADFGLMFYNARWYDPALGRFTQADSIVPGGVQGLDRYAYVNNMPTRFTDPSGHMCFPANECDTPHGDYWDVPLSAGAQDLIDFSGIVGKTPEQVIAIGVGHEMGGWNAHDLEIAKGHFANRFIEWAQEHCGGNFSSHNCMLNFFMAEYQPVQCMVYDCSIKNGRANRVHNKYWDLPNAPSLFNLQQVKFWNNSDGTTSINMQAGIDVMNNFWSDVQSRNGDYTHGGFDTGDYLVIDVKDQLGHDPVVGQDGILAMIDITTCQGGAGIAIIVDYQGYVTLGSTIGGKQGASVCNVGP